ncbi:diaminopimelate epimerase [Pelistega europaea]|uniref:Diaminopimelate epimerase n=1 Tax=Pelistega europaea TaxID=106147 RepID=A0A7Y4L977_9BURK|nr:diaminopimelate epimerase [Pelistega europaea]NOL49324.1 diaminopimelate epimerase [Pelistega europaea]
MKWHFTKMHGVGNDFVVLDGVRQAIHITPAIARAIAHRQFGIGADQILLVEDPSHPEAHFRYRIFNADGSEVEHCGNGSRCFVRFVHEQKLSGRNPLKAEIATGLITLTEHDNQTVSVEMGQTRFNPQDIAFDVDGLRSTSCGQDTLWHLPLANGDEVNLSIVGISNPHAVQVVDDVKTAPVAVQGPLIESHPRFKNRVNAGFMQVLNAHEINLRVYERGAGETLACGTGACAAAVAGIRRGLLESPVKVHTRGGDLSIAYDGHSIIMTGSATTVYEGTIDIDALLQSIPAQVLNP